MYKLCIFAGTTEGRKLVEFLITQPLFVTACVATEYGETLLPEGENLTVSAHRMTREEMAQLFSREGFDLVVDATHPYASVVTENICAACEETGTEYLRLLRSSGKAQEDDILVPDIAGAVDYLNTQEGNILLTTGSKELKAFSRLEDFSQRVYARVLPMVESLELCREAGVQPSHIFAMQGPFTRQMNLAMLESIQAKFLVTKESGGAGGFAEKLAAAREAGAKLVIIGSPPQVEGMGFDQVVNEICSRFGLTWKSKVTIVGIGPGSLDAMTAQARQAIRHAPCLIGAGRMLQAVAEPGQEILEAISPEKISEFIHNHPGCREFAVVMSGDVGFFSGTKKLLPLLEDCQVTLEPGLSSLVCLCAKLGVSYEDVLPVSLHGRNHNLAADVARNPRVFVLAGGENGMGRICQDLTKAGLGQVRVSVGQQLGYPEECIVTGTAQELAEQTFHSLSVALVENEKACRAVSYGLPDEAFLREEKVPMTKSEVRSVCLSKLELNDHSLVWDIGAGTGSVSVEMGRLCEKGHVYAIEQKESAVALLQENCRRFALENLTVVPGKAPEACEDLPAPTHAFIGGSSGNLRQIIRLLLEKNPNVRIVATAISLESQAELTQCLKEFAFEWEEVVSLSVAKARKAGSYHLMTGLNPILIVAMQGGRV